jgi:hypothetical protein
MEGPINTSESGVPLPAIPAWSHVLEDRPCRTCGYNLRTLPVDAACPECATPVALSLRGNLLRDSDPAWLRRLAIGSTTVIFGTIIRWFFTQSISVSAFGISQMFIRIGATAVTVVGIWILTLPDPSGLGEEEFGQLRIRSRAFGTAQLALVIAGFGFAYVSLPTSILPAIGMIDPAWRLCEVGWEVSLLWYLRKMAGRMENPTLARTLLQCALAVPIFSVVGIGASIWPISRRYRNFLHFASIFSTIALFRGLAMASGAIKDEAVIGKSKAQDDPPPTVMAK